MWAEKEEIGISAFVALGNKCDVSELDLIDYFACDPNTRVISLYLEGFKDGRGLMDLVRRLDGRKPIIVLKPGKTEKGRKAVQSHTHSIAGKDEVFQGVCKQLCLTRAADVVELYDFSKAFGFLRRPKGRNMVVVTSSGGCGILATDLAVQSGLNLVTLDEETQRGLKAVLPATCVIGNPLDLTGDANAERYKTAVGVASANSDIDFFLLIFGDPIPGACEIVQDLKSRIAQEIVVCYIGGGEVEDIEMRKMHRIGIPVFPTPERTVKAVNALFGARSR